MSPTAVVTHESENARIGLYRRQRFSSAREIGPLPAVKNPARRELCESSLFHFLNCYHKITFSLPWSDNQLEVIDCLQEVIEGGGQQAYSMPRGSGKTSLLLGATEWALLTGKRKFPVSLAADQRAAYRLLQSIKTDLEHNPLLLEDFPEVCYPIHKLDGISNRARGQLLNGSPTLISISQNRLILPTVEGFPSSGSIVVAQGLTASLRGISHKKADGEILRPDLVLLDDPQTDESAKSPAQCAMRHALIQGTVLGLAGPSKRISAVATLTVIQKDDLADRLLNRDVSPDWKGIRHKLIDSLPIREDLWNDYNQLRSSLLREGKPLEEANLFYLHNQQEMDRGCKPSWYDRKNEDEISAVQHVMHLKFRDEQSFWAEYQNEPQTLSLSDIPDLSQQEICEKLSNIARGIVPDRATRLCAGIDVQGKCLFYVVLAFDESGTIWVVDYGAFPEQRRSYYSLKEVTNTLQSKFKTQDLNSCVFQGLQALTSQLKSYKNESGVEIPVSRIVIDAAWGQVSDCVRRFCEVHKFKQILPAFGKSIRKISFSNPFKAKAGDRVGSGWRIPKPSKASKHVIFNSDFFKLETRRKLSQLPGSIGSLSLFGSDPKVHVMFADHTLSEVASTIEINGHSTEVFNLLPGQENHFLDCCSLAQVAASIDGLNPAVNSMTLNNVGSSGTVPLKKERKKTSFAELAQQQINKYRSQ